MDLIVTGYRPQKSNVWLPGHSVQSLNGSRGPGQPRGSIPSAWESTRAPVEQGRAGWRGSGNSNESPAKRRLQPRWAGGPATSGYLPPAGQQPTRPAGELRRWAKARGQLGHIPSSSPPSTKQFLPRDFYLGLSYLYILEARHHTYNIGLRIRI